MTKNEYLHALGLQLLFRNSASLGDMTETLKDYEAVLCEEEDMSAAIARLGTPQKAAQALRVKGSAGSIIHAAAAALLLVGLLRWALLMFERGWQPAGGDAAVFSCGAVLILCVLLRISARLGAQAALLPLRTKSRGEGLLLTLLCALTLPLAAAPFAGSYWVIAHISELTSQEMLLVGPKMDAAISVLCALCLALMLLSLWRTFSGSPKWAALFCLTLGAGGTLLNFRYTLSTLADTEGLWQKLLLCALPYAVALLTQVAMLLEVGVKAGQGEKLWTRR